MTDSDRDVKAQERVRHIIWDAPALLHKEAAQMTGVAFICAMVEGSLPLPPIMKLIGFKPILAEEGHVIFTGLADESHYNPIGSVHGGIFATLLDSATGCAAHTTLAQGEAYVTLDLKVNFLRSITIESGLLRCEGRVIHRGRTSILAEASLYDVQERRCAYATSTCLLLRTSD